jgi:hypothetical protein
MLTDLEIYAILLSTKVTDGDNEYGIEQRCGK